MACISPAAPSRPVKVPETILADDNGVPLQDITKISIGDEHPVEVTTTPSGSYTMTTVRGKGYSPSNKHYSPPFVRGRSRSNADDPFVSASRPRSHEPATPKSAIIMGKKTWRSNSNSSDDESSSASVSSFRSKSTARKLTFGTQKTVVHTPDGQRNPPNGPDVDPEDAQSVYPPEWCVFVANLLQSETDSTLTAAVHQVFSQYGKVYVKIRRDAKQMPFAFCQYTKLEHAKNALQDARGRLICGRPCRCEMAKADRFYVIQRKYEHGITPEEARSVLEKFGKIKSCSPASPFERAAFFVNDGIVVSFQMYDMGQAAMQALRNNHEYKMHNLEGYGSPLKPIHDRRSISTPYKAYLDRVEIDNRSIFVGNLPASATEADLHELFDTYGSILDISLRDSFSKFDSSERIYFAFIEFRSGITADSVVDAQDPFFLSGNKLRIAHKTTDNKKHGSPTSGSSTSYKSPTPRRRIEQATSSESQSTYVSAEHTSAGYGSPGYAAPAYGLQAVYGPQAYGTQGYTPSYGTPPYNSPQGYYQMSYAPQYGYGNFSYYPIPYGTAQGPYTTPFPPNAYPYQATPGIDPQSPIAPDTSGNPNTQPYWAPTTYSYVPQQAWTPPSTSSDANSPAPHCPVTNSMVTEVTEVSEETDDRSATPTPSRPNPAAEQPVETQK